MTDLQRWNLRTDTRANDMAHGITFHMAETRGSDVRGEFAIRDKKFHVDGTASITIAEGQYKYGTELIAQLYTRDIPPTVADRRADGYTRVQVYLGPADEETAAVLEQIAATIRNITRSAS